MACTSGAYPAFEKIPRLHRPITITEKIDGTNGLIYITTDDALLGPWDRGPNLAADLPGRYVISAGSKSRWLSLEADNFGFAAWVRRWADELVHDLGPGLHYGEWWGHGIQRGYGMPRGIRNFSLFNTRRWLAPYSEGRFLAPGLMVVPVIVSSLSAATLNEDVDFGLAYLREHGSEASPGFRRPEGLVVHHSAANMLFKVTLERDEAPKSAALEYLVTAPRAVTT
jgi:hypothetical protein